MGNNDSFSLNTVRNLNNALGKLNQSLTKLSSGSRINSARDDAAGLAIVSQLESSVKQLSQAGRNVQDSVSAYNIADSTLQQAGEISGRLAELSQQAANGTLSDDQRSVLNSEYQSLTQELQRIGSTTQFNGIQLVSGDTFVTQAGTGSDANSQITSNPVNLSGLASNIASQSISTQDGAKSALDSVNSFISSIADARGQIGATTSRLSAASEKNDSQRVAETAAASRIRDVDVAEETANLVRYQILAQGSTALSAQSNNLRASVVQNLLR